MAEERGFRTAYHHHMGTVCQSAEDIYTLMNGTERIGLLYDTGHLAPAGADCLEVLKNHWQRISHVHFKNIRKSVLWQSMQRNDSFHQLLLNGGFTCPGDDGYDNANGINFLPLIEFLVSKGYQGWCVVEAEQDPSIANPFIFAQLGYSTIKALTEKAYMKEMYYNSNPTKATTWKSSYQFYVST